MSDPREQRGRRGQTQRLNDNDRRGTGGGRRATERLSPDGDEWSRAEPLNPGWRSERVGARKAPRRGALPSSPQEFQLWLQAGGWRYVAGIALLAVVLLIAMLAFTRGDERTAGLDQLAPTTASEPTLGASGVGSDAALPTVTLPPPTPAAPQRFTVVNTGGQGLLLRPQPSTANQPLATLSDGVVVEQIGDDVPGDSRLWRHVRTAEGQEGYVAVDFLAPAQ